MVFDWFNWGKPPGAAMGPGEMYSAMPNPTGGVPPGQVPGMPPFMGMDPGMMQKLMAVQFISSGLGQIGQMDARRRGGAGIQQPAQQPNPMAMMLPMMQMQQMGMVAQDRAQKLAEKQRLNEAWYGKPTEYPAVTAGADAAPGGTVMRGGFEEMAPKELLPFLSVMGPEKGMDTLAQYAMSNLKKEPTPNSIREFQFAKDQGYTGTFEDWKKTAPATNALPAAPIQNFAHRQQLVKQHGENSPEVNRFDSYVRQLQIFNAGDRGVVVNPANPSQPQSTIPMGIPPAQTPQNQGAVAGAKKTAETTATAQANLPTAEANANYMLSLLDQITTSDESGGRRNHPGLSDVVGVPNPLTAWTPGTEAANFKALLDQVRGKQFLEAFESLKGGGQITQVEGEKATQAIARMNTAQSEKAFIEAAEEFKGIVRQGLNRAKMKARTTPANPSPSSGGWSIRPRS